MATVRWELPENIPIEFCNLPLEESHVRQRLLYQETVMIAKLMTSRRDNDLRNLAFETAAGELRQLFGRAPSGHQRLQHPLAGDAKQVG